MARPLRIDVAEGWYHVTARGNERRRIYRAPYDYGHFLRLLAELPERYAVRIHAYVLMDNHYHLLVSTPRANLSVAMQWLGVSYSVWFNRRHQRVGHLSQGRFKAFILDPDSCVLPVSRYLHLNPVRIAALGLSKSAQRQWRKGLRAPCSPAMVRQRIACLQQYRWSSYGVYTGREGAPDWLDAAAVLQQIPGGAQARHRQYRRSVEGAIREGLAENPWENLQGQLVLGSETFVKHAFQLLKGKGNRREQSALRALAPVLDFATIKRVVEEIKGEKWNCFCNRHGDWGRDLALWLGRRCGGLKLKDLAQAVGGLDYTSVSLAIKRLDHRAQNNPALAKALLQGKTQLSNVEM